MKDYKTIGAISMSVNSFIYNIFDVYIQPAWPQIISQLDECCFKEFDGLHENYLSKIENLEDTLFNSYLGLIP